MCFKKEPIDRSCVEKVMRDEKKLFFNNPFRHFCELGDGRRTYVDAVNSDVPARNGCGYSFHSEMKAIKIFIQNWVKRKKKHSRELILKVISVNKLGGIRDSKPCFMCVKHMKYLMDKFRVIIKKIYYSLSGENNKWMSCTLSDLLSEIDKGMGHVSKHFREIPMKTESKKFSKTKKKLNK